MFEQSVVEARALTARPWTLAVSVMGQAVLVTAAVVLPLLHPDTLKRVVMLAPIGGPPPAYRPPVAQTAQSPRPAQASARVFKCAFCAPTWIPPTIATIIDEPTTGAVGVSGDPGILGVPGGIGVPGAVGVGRVPDIAPPPRPKPHFFITLLNSPNDRLTL